MAKPKVIWEPFPGSQVRFLSCPVWECLLHGNRGGGKKVPNDSGVLTPFGWKKIQDLCVGDLVFSRNGKAYPVTGVFPKGISTIFKMTFQDGRTVDSGDEHLWVVLNGQKERIKTTEEIYNSGLYYGDPSHSQYKFRIPYCDPIELKERKLPIDPYILGCLIGDGTLTTRTPKIAVSDPFIKQKFKKYFSEFEIAYDKTTTSNFTIVDRNKTGKQFPGIPEKYSYKNSRNRLTTAIDYLHLNVTCKNKFIPTIYKTGSIQQRIDILCGLMDTDGTVSKAGTSEFWTTSPQLIKDVMFICGSLGIKYRLSEDFREGEIHNIRGSISKRGKCYRLYINTSLPIAKTPRKLSRIHKKKITNQQRYTGIASIEKTNKQVPMTCIAVDSPDHTYIIKDFIVTHNTDVLIMDYLQGVGRGYGADYKGLLLREATTELGDVISKTKKWIPLIFPSAKFNAAKKIWTFGDGETLWLNYARTEDDYSQYHGHSYSIISSTYVYVNQQKVKAGNVKIGDFIQTLQGPRKVTKVFKYKKPGVTISVLDEDLNLIGQQHQGLIHPVLTNDGWQRPGLSCLSQISLQSVVGKLYVQEVFQFLSGIHQEIQVVLQMSLQNPLGFSTSKLFSVQYSCLAQIYQQFSDMINLSPLKQAFHLYEGPKNLEGFLNQKDLGTSEKEWIREHQKILQLVFYCSSLISFLLQVQLSCIRLCQSILYDYLKLRSLHSVQSYQVLLQCLSVSNSNPLPILLYSQLVQDQIAWNDTFSCALSLMHNKQDYQDHYSSDQNHGGGIPLQVLGIDQSFFLKENDALEQFHHCKHKDAQDILFARNHNDDSSFSYTHPYTHESFETKMPLNSFSFSVEPFSCSSPIDMVDFEVDSENHYITQLDYTQNTACSQADNFHGTVCNQNCWIGWEEITNHPLSNIYLKLMSCNRSTNPKIPLKYRATCNPSGPGHQWVKQRFIDTIKVGKIFREELDLEFPDAKGELVTQKVSVARTHLKSLASENKALTKADPLYMAKIFSLTQDNKMLREAWVHGSWDLTIGGFFTDVWDPKIHVLEPFSIPYTWRLVRSFDWGSSRPWAVSYGFETNGEQPDIEGLPYIPKGSVIVPTEIYGWTGVVNTGDQATSSEIAKRVESVDDSLFVEYGIKCVPGPADIQIWEVRDGTSIAANLLSHGCRWTKAHKGPGSRISGWALIRQMLGAAKRGDLESPHLYFFTPAQHHIRTLPLMQRDKVKPEDIDTDGEDHCLDSLSYLLTRKASRLKRRKVGM